LEVGKFNIEIIWYQWQKNYIQIRCRAYCISFINDIDRYQDWRTAVDRNSNLLHRRTFTNLPIKLCERAASLYFTAVDLILLVTFV